jgi:hypothetical protein
MQMYLYIQFSFVWLLYHVYRFCAEHFNFYFGVWERNQHDKHMNSQPLRSFQVQRLLLHLSIRPTGLFCIAKLTCSLSNLVPDWSSNKTMTRFLTPCRHHLIKYAHSSLHQTGIWITAWQAQMHLKETSSSETHYRFRQV